VNEKVKSNHQTLKPVDEKSQKWIKRLTILVLIWGVLNLLFSSMVFGAIFILFAVLIRVSRNFMAIYALGVVLWILAAIQLLNASGFINLGFTEGAAQGTELILVAIANFAVGGLIIYRTKKLSD
jgi:nitrate reductase NapE component